MRLTSFVLALPVCLVAACSSDHVAGPTKPPPVTGVSAAINLAFTGTSPLFTSRALAINDSSVIVGFAAVNPVDPTKAVTWRPPGYAFTFLPDLGMHGTSAANAIARDGTVGGQACDDNGVCHPTFWRGGTLHVLDGLGQVNDICPCDSHTMIGRVIVSGAAHGAIWEDEILIDVGTPSGFANAELVSVAHGFIVGNAFNGTLAAPGTLSPFRWAPSTGWTALDGAGPVTDVNMNGTAVGPNVMWANGASAATPIPDGVETTAINDSGVVAGLFQGMNPFAVPAIWTQAVGWTMIGNDMNATVTAINNSDMVVGFTHDQGEDFGQLWQP